MHHADSATVRSLAEASHGLVAAALADAVLDGTGSRAPAVAIAAFDSGGIVAWQGAGEPRKDGAPVTRQTVFRIASMTKSFLAATALALVEEGKLDLARSVDAYVPGPTLLLRGTEQRVTVGELLSNRSGLPEDNAWGDRQLGVERSHIAELFAAGVELTAAPGVRYQYSNLGMSLVGRAIESVTGNAVEQEIRERFLDPLGLSQTRFAVSEYPQGADIALGFRTFDDGESFVPEPYAGPGALGCIGGMFSTVDDIARWAWFLNSAFTDAPDREDLLSARSRREMQRIHTPMPTPEATEERRLAALGYGLGLFAAEDRRFGRVIDHSGGLPGHSSHMRWHVESGIGVVAFANTDAFRCEPPAVAAHGSILELTTAASETVRPWEATLAAAEMLDGVLVAGTPITAAGECFADNFLPDAPVLVRERRFQDAVAEAGGLITQSQFAERIISAENAAHLRWRIDCAHAAVICEVRLVGVTPPRVQSLRTVLGAAGGSKSVGEGAFPADWVSVAASL